MTHFFVAMEAWDDDSDYDIFGSLEDAVEAFRGFRDGDEWRGVWRELWLIEHPVTEADFERYERETHGELWSLWEVWNDAETVVVERWTASLCEQEGFLCRGPREASVMIDGNVWELCDDCASTVGDENVWAVEA